MSDAEETSRRWRLVLGREAEADGGGLNPALSVQERAMDRALEALYESDRGAGLGSSSPNVARWLGDIRTYFPASIVQVMQRDALERLKLQQMLFEPELLATVEADVHLVATLMSLKNVIPNRTKETARQVVRKVVEQLERRLRERTVQAVRGALSRSTRTNRPRMREIDWDRTIRKNLRTYDPATRRLVPERLTGYGHKRAGLRDLVLLVDQSGSMAPSVVYSSIFAAVLASLKALRTQFIVFDTSIVDLTPMLGDPVDVLFGTQLGGGTDINRAIAYCQARIPRPTQTTLVIVSDLCEGGNNTEMLRRVADLVSSGVQVIALLALSDEGAPGYDARNAAAFADLGIPSFACTPDLFPDLMAAALQRQDIARWAARNDRVTVAPVR
jgi:uncharacterized protein with von Willebrand factor type A (vWA) domain